MEQLEDCHGADVCGVDDTNIWMGTENAWNVLGDVYDDGPDSFPATPTYIEVSGYLGSLEFQGYFLASNIERVSNFLIGAGFTEFKQGSFSGWQFEYANCWKACKVFSS